MTRIRSSPRQESAYRWVCARIRNAPAGQRLPSVHTMATEAGCSLITMWKAVGRLNAEGILQVVPRGGIFVRSSGGPAAEPLPVPTRTTPPLSWQPRWQQIADDLRGDLLRKTFIPGHPLPPTKELAAHYRASTPTIRRACLELTGQQLLLRDRRGYIVHAPQQNTPMAKVLILARSSRRMTLSWMAPWSTQIWREINVAAWRGNMRIELHSFSDVIKGDRATDQALADPLTLGVLILGLGLDEPEYQPFLQRISRCGKRVALLNEAENPVLLKIMAPMCSIRTFMIGCGTVCGREMGAYLTGKGINSIAVIYPAIPVADQWTITRRAGLAAGLRGEITDVLQTDFTSATADEQNILLDRDSVVLRAQFESIIAQTGVSCEIVDFPMSERIMPEYLQLRLMQRIMNPVFSDLAKNRSIDTWVGLGDAVALMALHFLQTRKERSPRRIRVTGFDDSERAHMNDLTSYNWNAGAIVQAMFDYILDTPHGRLLTDDAVVEIPGYVVERESSR